MPISSSNSSQNNGSKPKFVFTQATPLATWNVNHNLGYFPDIRVTDLSRSAITCGINNISEFQIELTFTAPFSGYAYIS